MDCVALRNTVVDLHFAGRGDADPCRLNIQHFQQSRVILVEDDWRARERSKFHRSANVIDMGVGDDDLLDRQTMLANQRNDLINVVSRIDHHRFMRRLIPDHGTVALQWTNGNDLVNHEVIVLGVSETRERMGNEGGLIRFAASSVLNNEKPSRGKA